MRKNTQQQETIRLMESLGFEYIPNEYYNCFCMNEGTCEVTEDGAETIHDNLLSLKSKWETEARIKELEIMQHQAFNVLKSSKAVGEWGELRTNHLKGDE